MAALSAAVCLTESPLAAPAPAVNTKTQATSEVFDINEKTLPAGDIPEGKAGDIAPPDFKEFEDDKFIENLLDEKTVPVSAPAPGNVPAVAVPPVDAPPLPVAPAAPVVPAAHPDEVMDSLLNGGSVSPAPAQPSPPAAQPAVEVKPETPPVAEVPQESPKAPETAVVPQAPVQVPALTAAKIEIYTENKPANDPLSEEEKATYKELKTHLLNFIAGFKGQAPVKDNSAIAGEAKAEDAENTAASEPAPATEAPAAPAASGELDDLLQAGSEKPAEVPPAQPVAQEAKTETPAAQPQAAEAPKEEVKTPEVANAPVEEPKKEEPVAAQKVAEPVVEPVPLKEEAAPKTKQVAEEKKETPKQEKAAAPVPQKQELSEADKAYFKLLEDKRANLPKEKQISNASKDTIENVSSSIAPVKKEKKEPEYISVDRAKKGEPAEEEAGVVKSKNNMDLSIRTVEKGVDTQKTKAKLEDAYKALMVGQTAAAIAVYKDVIAREPNNKDAFFGLATAYHKNSQFEKAREIYTEMLKKEPNNKDALNNFLVLVAEESPEDALIELEKLERVNSDFSPVPAQIAMIHLRLGDPDKAARYLRRAVLLSPENVTYKYNLAITYDKLQKYDQAIQLYRQVITSVQGGGAIPGSVDKVMERLSYLEGKYGKK